MTPALQALIGLLTILAIVVPAVLGFVSVDKRVDIVETDVIRIGVDVDDNEESITALKISEARQEAQYGEILRRFDEQQVLIKELAK